MEKAFKVAVILTAYDRMTREIRDAVGKSTSELGKLQKESNELFGKGMAGIAGGAAIMASLAPPVAAFSDLEASSIRLKTSMMDAAGTVGPEFEKVNKLAIQLGNRLPGTTADFQNLFEVMLNNGIPAQTLLDGVGESAAYLAVALKMPYEEAGKFAAKMKEATGVANSDMLAFLDTIAKTKNLGVEVGEMQYAFGRSAGSLKLLGLQGLEASKGVAAVYAQLVRSGLSGETVGTGFASIVNNLLDAKKMEKTNEAAKQLGVSLTFFKDGRFLGIENFIAQLDKLRGFTAEQRASVVNALTGGGQDAQMLQTLINNGVEGYNKIQASMNKQATLNMKVEEQLKTLASIWESTTGTITNMLAAIGAAIAPELKMIADYMGAGAAKMQEFFSENPKLAKFISLVIAGAGALMIMVGVINLVKAAVIAMNVAALANPFVLVAMAAIAAVALIYTYWEPIKQFFIDLWEGIKNVFNMGIAWIKENWQLLVLGLINPVAGIGILIVKAIEAFFPELYNAGANIINQIKEGIKSKITEAVEAVSDMTKKMRAYLPFSPAKEGAFKDLHKVKIVETIAHAVKPAPLVNAMRATTMSAMMAATPVAMPAMAQGSSTQQASGGISITYAPQITLGAGPATPQAEDFQAMLKKHSKEIAELIKIELDRQNRRKFQ